jgi:hypothetical protein
VTEFAAGTEIDGWLSKIHVESGGSGAISDHETYELSGRLRTIQYSRDSFSVKQDFDTILQNNCY